MKGKIHNIQVLSNDQNSVSLFKTFPMRLILRYVLLPAIFLLFISGCSQKDGFPSLKGPYLGQEPPGDEPELFMFGVVTTLDVEYCISFLDQGRVCVFGRDDIGINYTYLKNGVWTEPQQMPLDSKNLEWKHNAGPDDKTLYFMSPRPVNTNDTTGDLNIYKMKWMGSGWSGKEMLPFPPNSEMYHEIYPSVTNNGTIYFHGGQFRNQPDMNDDIYRSRFVNDSYMAEERLNEPISTEYGEYDSFIAPDESYLMFGSNRPGGFGRYDSYICFQKEDGTWTNPANMCQPLNSLSWENRVMVTNDGLYLFFVSGRNHELLNEEMADGKWTSTTGFYWVRTGIIENLKEEMLNSVSAADVISSAYQEKGIDAAVKRLSGLKNDPGKSYYYSPFELLMLCRGMIENGKADDSDIFYQALLDNLENDYRIRRGYGMICVMHGFPEKGLDLLEHALSDHPVELMVTAFELGSDLINKTKIEDAYKVMYYNVGKFAEHYITNYGMARACKEMDNTEEALMYCKKSLEINPDYNAAENLMNELKSKL